MDIQNHINRELLEKLISEAAGAGIQLEILDFIDADHQLSYWYGGDLAIATKGNLKMTISAMGDINATLFDGLEEQVWCRDKRNDGRFYEDMRPHIPSDEHLRTYMDHGILVFVENNWFEWSVEDTVAKEHLGPDALDNIFDEDLLSECLSVETLTSIFEYVLEWEEEMHGV